MISRLKAAHLAIILGVMGQLCFPGVAGAVCAKEFENFGLTVEVEGGGKWVDVDDVLIIRAHTPRKVDRIEIMLDDKTHSIPNSGGNYHAIPIKRLSGSRQLSLAGIPLKARATLLQVNAFVGQDCGYGTLKEKSLYVRTAQEDFAVVIGVNVTDASSRSLSHARNDAYDMARHLIREAKLEASNVWLFTDNQAEAAKAVPGARGAAVRGSRGDHDGVEKDRRVHIGSVVALRLFLGTPVRHGYRHVQGRTPLSDAAEIHTRGGGCGGDAIELESPGDEAARHGALSEPRRRHSRCLLLGHTAARSLFSRTTKWCRMRPG